MMNPGGAGGDRRYRAIGARQTGRYILMTLHFENKLHSNCKSQPVKHTHGPHPPQLVLKLQGKIWAGLIKEQLDRELDHKCS